MWVQKSPSNFIVEYFKIIGRPSDLARNSIPDNSHVSDIVYLGCNYNPFGCNISFRKQSHKRNEILFHWNIMFCLYFWSLVQVFVFWVFLVELLVKLTAGIVLFWMIGVLMVSKWLELSRCKWHNHRKVPSNGRHLGSMASHGHHPECKKLPQCNLNAPYQS